VAFHVVLSAASFPSCSIARFAAAPKVCPTPVVLRVFLFSPSALLHSRQSRTFVHFQFLSNNPLLFALFFARDRPVEPAVRSCVQEWRILFMVSARGRERKASVVWGRSVAFSRHLISVVVVVVIQSRIREFRRGRRPSLASLEIHRSPGSGRSQH
jgi:hypothetical protein